MLMLMLRGGLRLWGGGGPSAPRPCRPAILAGMELHAPEKSKGEEERAAGGPRRRIRIRSEGGAAHLRLVRQLLERLLVFRKRVLRMAPGNVRSSVQAVKRLAARAY